MMYGYGTGMTAWGYVLMIAALVAVVGLVTMGVLLLIRSQAASRRPATEHTRRQPAERILEQRFARGEVDEDEFQHTTGLLRSHVKP
jgi:putative membrane protein